MQRFTTANTGPVPITPAMDPQLQAILRAGNEGVQSTQSNKKKRQVKAKRFVWEDEDRFRLGRTAHEVSNKEALRAAKHINPNCNESTIRSFKKAYRIAIQANPALSTVQRAALKKRKRGKPVKFGKYDADIITYLRAIRRSGGKVNRPIVQGAALGILRRKAPHMLWQRNAVSRGWCNSILRRIKFVKRKGTKAAKKVPADAPEQIHRFKNRIYYTMKKFNIPACMFVTFDEISSALVPASDWTLEEQGATQVGIVGLEDKRNVTLGLSFSGSKELLPTQIIYEGKTNMCHAQYDFPPHLKPTHSESHWSTEKTCIELIDDILDPYMEQKRAALMLPPTQYGLLSWDVFKAHCTQAVLDLLEARRIKVVFVPPSCTGLASPNDHPEFNKNVKDLNTSKFTHFYADKVGESLANGEEELFIQFPAAEMKPLHAKWTAESLEFAATQEQWMENALRGVGIWEILQGTFVPDPLLENEFWQPTVATAEEAALHLPDSESEYEFVQNSDDEADPNDHIEGEEEVDYNLEDEVSDEDPDRTPILGTPLQGDEAESEQEQPSQQFLKRRRTLVDESDDDETQLNEPTRGKPKEDYPLEIPIPETQVHTTITPSRSARSSRISRAIDNEASDLQRALAESMLTLSRPPQPTLDILREEDNEGILEEETTLCHQKLLQRGQWRVVFPDEAWQLAKKLLIPADSLPPKTRKHPTQNSYIVARNVLPSNITKIKGDGACMFRALSFSIFRTEDCHRAVRKEILHHMQSVWDEEPRLRLLAALKYQEKTGRQRHVRPSELTISFDDYVDATNMDLPYTWGGSTELEAAALWLKTLIKVFHHGNPKFPPKSWITYGTQPEYHNTYTLLLQWTNGDHYDYVNKLV